jgi:hypothetical protein
VILVNIKKKKVNIQKILNAYMLQSNNNDFQVSILCYWLFSCHPVDDKELLMHDLLLRNTQFLTSARLLCGKELII